MKIHDLEKNYRHSPKKSKIFDLAIYFIFATTMILLSPLIFMLVMRFLNINIQESADMTKANQSEINITKARNYSYVEHSIDLGIIENLDYKLVTAKVTDNSDGIFLCSEVRQGDSLIEILRILKVEREGETKICNTSLSNRLLQKIRAKEYSYKDYGDGYIYLAGNEYAYLFDLDDVSIAERYSFPQEYNIYHAALSNDRTMTALATDRGLFVDDVSGLTPPKELISATINVSGVKTLPKNPVWSVNDEYIYYTLYADTYIKSAGRTPLSLGANEQFAALENTNFYVLNNDSIFYYHSANYHTSFENLFRCGYFNVTDRKMTDMIKSQIYYFDIRVSSDGTHLAALSYNGKLKKISVIDIKTKKNIYSALYDDIYEFEFSPNEKNIIIYGVKSGIEDLRIVEINWEEIESSHN